MRRSTVVAVLAVLLLAGCGGGGGDNTQTYYGQEYDYWVKIANPAPGVVIPPSSQLSGTYDLTGFDIDYYDSDLVYLFSETEADYSPWGGTMLITPSDIGQDWTLHGVQYIMSGSYTVSWAGSYSGTFHVTDSFGSYDADFSISGNYLTTDSGLLPFQAGVSTAGAVDQAAMVGPGRAGGLGMMAAGRER
jgi:hypothetical protein